MDKKPFRILILPGAKNVGEVTKRFPFPVELVRGSYRYLKFVFREEEVAVFHKGVDLQEYSFVWLSSTWNSRDLAYAVKLYLEKYRVPYTFVEKSTSKITDHMIFALGGIRTPDTLFLDQREVSGALVKIREVCGYPLIIKDIRGSLGADSALVLEEKKLIEVSEKLPKHKKYLFQRYIPNEYDWGVLVANGRVVSGEKSYPKAGEFRNNTCNGAEEVFVSVENIPIRVREMALQSSDALGLSWSRSDIIVDKNTQDPYLMEVNRRPQLSTKTSEMDGAYTFLSQEVKKARS